MGVVVSVADGDTFDVEIAGERDTVRLIGVDTPETKHPTKGVQCWGPEASDFTKSLLSAGTRVRLVRDVEARDRYGRLLAYVYLDDTNVFVNRELVRLGFARPYPFEPNTTHKATFADAAWEAQGERRGLWAAC
ncbi:MAG: thermonuclease family protein [Actinomycetota bacterium]